MTDLKVLREHFAPNRDLAETLDYETALRFSILVSRQFGDQITCYHEDEAGLRKLTELFSDREFLVKLSKWTSGVISSEIRWSPIKLEPGEVWRLFPLAYGLDPTWGKQKRDARDGLKGFARKFLAEGKMTGEITYDADRAAFLGFVDENDCHEIYAESVGHEKAKITMHGWRSLDRNYLEEGRLLITFDDNHSAFVSLKGRTENGEQFRLSLEIVKTQEGAQA